MGGTLKVTTVDGKQATLKVIGVYRDPMMLNGIMVSASGYAALFPTPQPFMVFAKAQPGADIAADAGGDQDGAGVRADRRGADQRRSTRTAPWGG